MLILIVSLLSFSVFAVIAIGLYFEFKPVTGGLRTPAWVKGSVAFNLLFFITALLAILLISIQEVLAVPVEAAATAAQASAEISIGKGLALIGIGLPTAFATIGAGISVGPIGASSLAAISEKPENFGRSLIYLGLAEGIAIYGLVVTILLLGKI